MKRVERLGATHAPDGTELVLYRHDGSYFIRADGIELMSTRRHQSEDRLAELACEPLRDVAGARALIGGLGLGFTLKVALHVLGADAEVVVAELLADVIAWNANPEYEISASAMRDQRVRIVHNDVANVLRGNPGAFDAIMLDVDNGAEALTTKANAALYSAQGVSIAVTALRPGGTLAYWAASDEPRFSGVLERAGLAVRKVRVRAHGTAGPTHTLYVATRR